MKKSVLVIGGTQFVGRHIVELGLSQGHDITLFTRGKTNPELFADVKHIVGDRRTDIALIGDTHWDVVIDTCGYLVSEVAASTGWLQQRCDQYVFISSVSAYASLQPFHLRIFFDFLVLLFLPFRHHNALELFSTVL